MNLTLISLALVCSQACVAAEAAGDELFVRRIAPLLHEKCLACHGKDEAKIKGDLDMRTLAGFQKGGQSGDPAIVAGQPEKSPLYLAVTRLHSDDWEPMPPKEADKLYAEQVGWIKEWIADGAPWPDETQVLAIAKARTQDRGGKRREFNGVFDFARNAMTKQRVAKNQFPPKLYGFLPEDYGNERVARKVLERLKWELERYEPFAFAVYNGRTPQMT